MASTKHSRASASALRTSELSRWKPLDLSSKKFSSISKRQPYSTKVCTLVGSSLTTYQYSPLLVWRAKARETGPNWSAVIATLCRKIARPGARVKSSTLQEGRPDRETPQLAFIRIPKRHRQRRHGTNKAG